MRLRYYIGVFAALLFTACSVEVDLDESSEVVLKGVNAHQYEKAFFANGQTGFGVVFDKSGKADIISGTYDLLYIASDIDLIKLNDYEKGSFNEAYIKYKATSYAPEELSHIYKFYKAGITVPGTKEVNISPSQLTQEYTVKYNGTDTNAPAQLKGTFRGFPSMIGAMSGELSVSSNAAYNFSIPFTLDKTGTISLILPKMSTLPPTFGVYLDYDKKGHKATLNSKTIVIE